MSDGRRILVGNVVVGEWIGDAFVHTTQDKHRKRTYVWCRGTLTVTVGDKTETIIMREEHAA